MLARDDAVGRAMRNKKPIDSDVAAQPLSEYSVTMMNKVCSRAALVSVQRHYADAEQGMSLHGGARTLAILQLQAPPLHRSLPFSSPRTSIYDGVHSRFGACTKGTGQTDQAF